MTDIDRVTTLENFRDSIIVPLVNTDAEKWPIRAGRVVRLVADSLAEEFFGDLAVLVNRGWSRREIAELFGTPTRLWRLSHHLLQGLRMRSASLQEQQDAILTILGLVAELKGGSPFLVDDANLILTNEAIDDLYKQTKKLGTPNDDARAWSHRCAGVFWSYAEALYFTAHELGVEVHGPYRMPGNQALLVRDFFASSPNDLWPEVVRFANFDSIRIAVIYDDFRASMDVYNNLYLGEGVTLPSRAAGISLWRNGSIVETAEIRQVCATATDVITRVATTVESWSLLEIARRYVELFWWRKRELSLAVRGEWRPDAAIMNRITEDAIPPASASNASASEMRRQFDLTRT
jgi:hypothetical protein